MHLRVLSLLLMLVTSAHADTPGSVARRLEGSTDPRVQGLPACARDGTTMQDCGMGSITRCPACPITISCTRTAPLNALFMVGAELARKDGAADGPPDMSATLRIASRPELPNGVNVGLHDDGFTYFRRSSEFEGGSDSLTSYVPVAPPPTSKLDRLCAFVASKGKVAPAAPIK